VKIAIAASAPDLDATVEPRLGLCPYLLLVDTETMAFEAVPVPSGRGGPGAGVRTVALAAANDAHVILAGYISPSIAATLRESGIDVITPVSGNAREAVEKYARGELHRRGHLGAGGGAVAGSLKRSARQFASVLPVLVGVIMLVGLFKTFVTGEALFSLFTGRPLLDTLLGAVFGSILAGNPVNSYVIGDALLAAGVSLYAATAVILTWVSVGLVQLPAEISALGVRFAVSRTVAAFILSIAIAFVTALLVGGLA